LAFVFNFMPDSTFPWLAFLPSTTLFCGKPAVREQRVTTLNVIETNFLFRRTRLYSTTLPYDDYDQSTTSSTLSSTASTPLSVENPPSNDDRPEIMLRPPAITWTGRQEGIKTGEEDPLSSLESRFKIQAQLDEPSWKEKLK
jgi:hypothetical protein